MKNMSIGFFELKVTRMVQIFLLLIAVLYANETATITVQSGEHHTFLGLGANKVDYYRLNDMSQATIDSATKLLYGPEHANFRVCRLRAPAAAGGRHLGGAFRSDIISLKKVNPDVKLLYCPQSNKEAAAQQDMAGFVARHMRKIHILKDSFDIIINAIGAINEPNNDSILGVDNNHIAELVTIWGDTLAQSPDVDIRNMKLVAPECSNVLNSSGDHPGATYALMRDSSALAALAGFGYHCYGYPMTKWFADTLRPFTLAPNNKEVWQTEAGPDAWGAGEVGEISVYNAAVVAGNCLADINLIANYWCFNRDYASMPDSMYQQYLRQEKKKYVDYIKMANILFQVVDGSEIFVMFLKYYYLREISKALPPGTGLRMCTSDLIPWKSYHDPVRFEYMFNTIAERPQLNSACGFDSATGKWGLAVINKTGIGARNDTSFNTDGSINFIRYYWAHSTDYDVTFHVEELKNCGEVEFTVTRCNITDTVKNENNVIMRNGEVTVTVRQGELVTLKSVEPGCETDIAHSVYTRQSEPKLRFQTLGHSTGIGFTVPPEHAGKDITLSVYTTQGRLIQTLFNGHCPAGLHSVVFDHSLFGITPAADGIMYVKFSVNGHSTVQRMIVYK